MNKKKLNLLIIEGNTKEENINFNNAGCVSQSENFSQHIKVHAPNSDIEIVLSDEAKEFLAKEGYDREFGARPLRRSIQRLLEDPLSEELLQGKYKAGSTIIISLNKDENTLEFESVEAPDEPPVDFVDSES